MNQGMKLDLMYKELKEEHCKLDDQRSTQSILLETVQKTWNEVGILAV